MNLLPKCVGTTVNNAREKGIIISNPGSFKGVSGHGLEARYADHAILIGNRKLMDDNNLPQFITDLQG